MKSSTRWSLVTFALGLSCGIAGKYIPDLFAATVTVIFLSALFALFGGLAVETND